MLHTWALCEKEMRMQEKKSQEKTSGGSITYKVNNDKPGLLKRESPSVVESYLIPTTPPISAHLSLSLCLLFVLFNLSHFLWLLGLTLNSPPSPLPHPLPRSPQIFSLSPRHATPPSDFILESFAAPQAHDIWGEGLLNKDSPMRV